jgi:hypothetical protein
VRIALCEFVRGGGQLTCKEETDQDWLDEHPDDPWIYFATIPVPGFGYDMYIKVKLLWGIGDAEDDAFVQIVSFHKAGV